MHDQSAFSILSQHVWRHPSAQDRTKTILVVALLRRVRRIEDELCGQDDVCVLRRGGLRYKRDAQHDSHDQVEKKEIIFRDSSTLVLSPHMSERRSDIPSTEPVEETVQPSNPQHVGAKSDGPPFDLSPAQYAKVTRAMLAVVRLVGRHSAVSPEDAVQQTWVTALSNPKTKRPSIDDFEKFVTYMRTLARYEAMANRQCSLRRQQREIAADVDIAESVAGPFSLDALEAQLTLEGPFTALEPDEQELLHALYRDGKTIHEIKVEQDLAWSTVDSRKQRLLKLLYAALQAMVAGLFLVPKKARAFVASAKRQAAHIGGTVAMTGACGVLVPTGSSFMSDPSMPSGLTAFDSGQTDPTKAAALSPSFVHEVEPEEPKAIDAATNECSAADMRCIKTASSVAKNLMPMTFVLGVALSQAACAGRAQQTPARQEEPEEEPDGMVDPYEVACDQERARGKPCPPKEVWQKLGTPR